MRAPSAHISTDMAGKRSPQRQAPRPSTVQNDKPAKWMRIRTLIAVKGSSFTRGRAAIQFFHVQLRVGPSRALQLEPVGGGTCGEGRGGLQREHAQRLSWRPREPFQREVRHYWYLSRHEKLPEMSRGSLVGFVHDAEYRNVNQHQSQGGYGHCEWKQSARLLHRWDVHQHLRG